MNIMIVKQLMWKSALLLVAVAGVALLTGCGGSKEVDIIVDRACRVGQYAENFKNTWSDLDKEMLMNALQNLQTASEGVTLDGATLVKKMQKACPKNIDAFGNAIG